MALRPFAQIELPGISSAALNGPVRRLESPSRGLAQAGQTVRSAATQRPAQANPLAWTARHLQALEHGSSDPFTGPGGLPEEQPEVRPKGPSKGSHTPQDAHSQAGSAAAQAPSRPTTPNTTPTTASLFDPSERELAQRMALAFARWFDSMPPNRSGRSTARSDSTREVYADLWGSFSAWCCARRLDLPDIGHDDLVNFLAERGDRRAGRELNKRYKLRMLRLIAAVIKHEASAQQVPANLAPLEVIEADPDVRHAEARGRAPPVLALNHAQARSLIAFTTSTQALRGIGVQSPFTADWQAVRARACVALQLGAGLTPAQVRALHVEHVVHQLCPRGRGMRPWKVVVPQLGEEPSREVPLMPWATGVLLRWLQVRQEQGMHGTLLLPSDKGGAPMSRSMHYLAVKAVLQGAQIPGVAKLGGDSTGTCFGSYVLRHTFAVICLHAKYPREQVGAWLGVTDLEKLQRYERIVFMPEGAIFGAGLDD